MAGIIVRARHPDSRAKKLYKLTPKGVDLIPVLVEIIQWSEKYHQVHPYAREFAKLLKKDKAGVLKGLYESMRGRE